MALRPGCLVSALFLILFKYTTFSITNLLYISTPTSSLLWQIYLRILYNFLHQNAMERYAPMVWAGNWTDCSTPPAGMSPTGMIQSAQSIYIIDIPLLHHITALWVWSKWKWTLSVDLLCIISRSDVKYTRIVKKTKILLQWRAGY